MGKGEDDFEAASAAVVVGLSNIVGLINTNRTNLESFFAVDDDGNKIYPSRRRRTFTI